MKIFFWPFNIRIWNAFTYELLHEFNNQYSVDAIEYSPNGKYFAIGSEKGVVNI